MKLQSGKATPSCLSKASMMELRSGKIVGHKRVAPSDFKFIQGPFGRPIKMFKKRSEGGGMEWLCETCNTGERWGRCRIRSCAHCHTNREYCIRQMEIERRMQEREARQEEEACRRFRGSNNEDNSGSESDGYVSSKALAPLYDEAWGIAACE